MRNEHGKQDRIDEMYAFISSDETGEGVVALTMSDGTTIPMVGADMMRINDLRPIAQDIANHARIKIKLIKLSMREELEEINPQ
jgi:hypothetical protein